MSVASAVAQSCAQGCATAVNARWGSSYPATLALLWPVKLTAPGILKSAVGPAPVFTDTPTVDSSGVTPGDGPSFADVVTWTDGGTLVVRWTADTASADIVGDVQVFGPVYVNSSGLLAKDGTNTAACATSWAAGDVVTAVVQVTDGVMRIDRPGLATNAIKNPNDITSSTWTTTGSAVRTSANLLTMAAASNSRLMAHSSNYIQLTTGQTLRFSVRMSNLTTANNRIQIAISELVTPYAETGIAQYAFADGLLCVEHVATKNCNALVYIGNLSSSPGTVELREIRCSVKTGNINSLVSFGDSICNGAVEVGSLVDNISSYTSQYATAKSAGYRNRGVSGERLDQIAARFAAQVGTPATLFLEGGVNDIFKASTDPNTTMRNSMTSMINAGKALGAKIVCFDIHKIPTFGAKESWRVSYNEWLAGFCETEGIQLVPMSQILANGDGSLKAEYFTADTTHPNKLGHAAITEWLIENVAYIGDTVDSGNWTPFDSSMPALSLSPDCPGDLRSVQEWKKVASAKEIERY